FDTAFAAPNVHVVTPQPPQGAFPFSMNAEALLQMRERRREVIAGLPGVDGVAFSTSAPGQYRQLFTVGLAPPDAPEERVDVTMQTADPAFFETLNLDFVAGRAFEVEERASVVVNEALARSLWNRTDVVGEVLPLRAAPPGTNVSRWEVVGVVRN